MKRFHLFGTSETVYVSSGFIEVNDDNQISKIETLYRPYGVLFGGKPVITYSDNPAFALILKEAYNALKEEQKKMLIESLSDKEINKYFKKETIYVVNA